MQLEITLKIIIGTTILILFAGIEYAWLRFSHRKPKRERFNNFEERSILERGHEQFQNLVSRHLIPPIVMYK